MLLDFVVGVRAVCSGRQDVRESGDVMVVGHGIYRFLGTLGHPVARVPGRQVARSSV